MLLSTDFPLQVATIKCDRLPEEMTGDASDARIVCLPVVMALLTEFPPGHMPLVRFVAKGAVAASMGGHDVQPLGIMTAFAGGHAGRLVTASAILLTHRPFRVDLVTPCAACRRRVTRLGTMVAGKRFMFPREENWVP